MWVVEPSRSAARKRSAKPVARRGRRGTPRCARACAASIAATISSVPRPACALEQLERERDQDPARRRRRVGQHLAAAEAGRDRLARDRLVGGEVAGARACRRARAPSPRSPRRLAAVERLRALGAEPLERVAELGEAERVALAEQVALRRVDLARLLVVGEDRREDREEVGLLGVEIDALAGERAPPGAASSASGTVPNRSSARSSPAGVPGHAARGGADVEDLRDSGVK